VVDATLLAYAGLKRLGLGEVVTTVLETSDFLPAVGQGAICIETRADDAATIELLRPIHHLETETCLLAERAFLRELDGSCRTPIGGLATLDGERLSFRGLILKADGSEVHGTMREGSAGDAVLIGADAGQELKRRGGSGFFAI
jgi:hydroxymethylbilane synthase